MTGRRIHFVTPTNDAWRAFVAPITADFELIGVPFRLETNAPAIAERAAELFLSAERLRMPEAELTAIKAMADRRSADGPPDRTIWPEPSGMKPEAKWPSAVEEPEGWPMAVQSDGRSNVAESPGVTLRLFVHDAPECVSGARPAPVTRVQGGYLMINDGDSFGFADRRAGFAAAFVTPTVAADMSRLSTYFLELPAVYIACRDRPVTLHAAGVAVDGRCVLLTGAQGAGKSTLAYACLRNGFQVLAEDIVFGVGVASNDIEPTAIKAMANRRDADGPPDRKSREEPPVFYGHAPNVHLLPDAVRFFPELAGVSPIEQVNGERKLRIAVGSARLASASIRAVCSIGRCDDPISRIEAGDPVAIQRALTRFTGDPPLDKAAMASAAQRLASGRIAHFVAGTDPNEAAGTLRRFIRSL